MFKNTVDLIGFLGEDAEVKVASDSSTNFTVLSLATKESWKKRDTSEWESRTEWHKRRCLRQAWRGRRNAHQRRSHRSQRLTQQP